MNIGSDIDFGLQDQEDEDRQDEEEDEENGGKIAYSGYSDSIQKNDMSNYGVYYNDTYNYAQHMLPITDSNFVACKNNQKSLQSLYGKEDMSVGLLHQPNRTIQGLKEQFEVGVDVREVLEALDDEAYIETDNDDYFDLLDQTTIQTHPSELLNAIPVDENKDGWEQFRKFKNENPVVDSDSESNASETTVQNQNPRAKSVRKGASTNFSMTSSSMFRTPHLTLLDERFDRVLDQYTEDDVGDVDIEDEEVVGVLDAMNDVNLDEMFTEFLSTTKLNPSQTRLISNSVQNANLDLFRTTLHDSAKQNLDAHAYVADFDSANQESPIIMPEIKRREVWDCESVLTGTTNIYNHPILIREVSKKEPRIHLDRHGVPTKPAESEEEDSDGSDCVKVNLGLKRVSCETPAEKQARKLAVKTMAKLKRVEKKILKGVYKQETMRQGSRAGNERMQVGVTHIQ